MFVLIIFGYCFCQFYDLNGIIGDGQSVSVGYNSQGLRLTTQPFRNLKLSLGQLESSWPLDPNSTELSLVPLVEPIRTIFNEYVVSYPRNIWGETPHSAFANQLTSLNESFVTVHTVVGESGMSIERLKKGADDDGFSGRAYAATLFEVEAIKRLAKEEGKSYGVNAILLTHGEADRDNQQYGTQVVELLQNYTQDISAITGQTNSIVLFLSQQNTRNDEVPNGIALSTMFQWQLGLDFPELIYVTGPKYQYYVQDDHLHLSAESYDLLGEKYAEVYNEVMLKGNKQWQPLQPRSISLCNVNQVNVTFHVPNPPLVWHDEFPPPHTDKGYWQNGKGFEATVNDIPVDIEKVDIIDESVIITVVSNFPTSGRVKIGYAATNSPARPNGAVRWGFLKDSDDFVGFNTQIVQPNFALAFEIFLEL